MRTSLKGMLLAHGARGGASGVLPGAAGLLDGEADGLATYFTYSDNTKRVAKYVSSVLTEYTPDAFLTNSGTSPKQRTNGSGVVDWTAHNMFLNSGSPVTQTVTTINGATYTVTVTGSGSMAMTSGGSGTASAGSPATFTATGTSTICTITGSLTVIQMNRGDVATAYLATTGVAAYGVAIDHDPLTPFASRGLLAEPAATDLVLQSNQFDSVSWNKVNATVSANVVTAPNGKTVADKILETTANNEHYVNGPTVTNATLYTASCYFKAAEVSVVSFRGMGLSPTQDEGVFFDLSAGTASAVAAIWTSWTITSVGDGWYRCTATGTSGGTAGLRLSAVNGTNDTSYVGNTSNGFYAWNAQLETGDVVSSPIPTFTTTVTRAADNANHPTSALSFYSATAGLVAVGAKTPGTNAAEQTLFNLGDGTANERIRIFRNTSQEIHVVVTDGGAAQADINLGTVAINTAFTVGISWEANSIKASLNAGSVTTDSSATLPTMTTFRYGAAHTAGTEWRGYITKTLYLPRVAASDAELISLQSRVA